MVGRAIVPDIDRKGVRHARFSPASEFTRRRGLSGPFRALATPPRAHGGLQRDSKRTPFFPWQLPHLLTTARHASICTRLSQNHSSNSFLPAPPPLHPRPMHHFASLFRLLPAFAASGATKRDRMQPPGDLTPSSPHPCVASSLHCKTKPPNSAKRTPNPSCRSKNAVFGFILGHSF